MDQKLNLLLSAKRGEYKSLLMVSSEDDVYDDHQLQVDKEEEEKISSSSPPKNTTTSPPKQIIINSNNNNNNTVHKTNIHTNTHQRHIHHNNPVVVSSDSFPPLSGVIDSNTTHSGEVEDDSSLIFNLPLTSPSMESTNHPHHLDENINHSTEIHTKLKMEKTRLLTPEPNLLTPSPSYIYNTPSSSSPTTPNPFLSTTPKNSIDDDNEQARIVERGKKILVAGTGFLCDAYDLFVINLVIVILKQLYAQSSTSSSIVSTAALWGSVAGQLVFGFLADRIGRRIGFIITLSFIIIGAFGSTLSFDISVSFNIYIMLAIWRCILGFGIGGEYPLSATISSETSESTKKRGSQVASVFSMQGVGIILSPVIVAILLKICGPNHIDVVWRLALAIGGIPGLIMIYFRIRMKETTQYATRAKVQKRDMFLIIKKYWKTLIGTAGAWLIIDITFYANGLFNATMVSIIGFAETTNSYDIVMNATITSIYLALLGLPGYFAGIFLIDRLGRKTLQMIGFLLLGITYIVLGLAFSHIVKIKWLFIIVYGLTFFFSNAGPNTTTFVIPSESFPTKVRATCHGISAAAGKIGAVIGGAAITPFKDAYGLDKTLMVCGGVAFVGFIFTLLLVKETMGKELEEDDDDLELEETTPGIDNNTQTNNNNV
eukprot:gene10755-13163_t